MEYNVTDNTDKQQFEIHSEGEIAFLVYRFYKNDIALMHTEVPKALEGKGVGTALVQYAFQYAKDHSKSIIVYCPFVAAYLKRHPELKSMVDTKFPK